MADEELPPEGTETIDAPEETIDAPEVDAPPTMPTVEELAGEMGWTPQDKWRGDPEKWRPAHDFMRSTVDVNRNMARKLDGLQEQVGNMARTSAQLTEQAVRKAREELTKQRLEAVEFGDIEAFKDAEKKLGELQTPEPQESITPEGREFADKNAHWFGKDREATGWAVGRTQELARQGLGPARQLAIVEREAKELFPEYFEEKPKAKAVPLNDPVVRGKTPAKKGFSSLPPDVQKAALDYEKRGVTTKEEYARIYYEEEEA